MGMEIHEEKKGNTMVFALSGRLDSATSPGVENKILDAIEAGAHDVILDFN